MAFLGIIILCPIFCFLIIKNILYFCNSKIKRIVISIVTCILNVLIGLYLLSYMGIHYNWTFIIYVVLNIIIIALIIIIKLIIKLEHKKRIFVAFLFIIIGSTVFIKIRYENYLFSDLNKNIIIISAYDLIKNFNENEIIAGNTYKGKIVEINGIIIYTESPKDFRPLWDASNVWFGEDSSEKEIIQIYFDEIIAHNFEIGQEITIRCKYKEYHESSFGNFIIFNKGRVKK